MNRFFNIIVCIIMVIGITSGTVSGQTDISLADRFVEFASIPSVSGFEDSLRNYIMSQLPDGFTCTVDNMGNLIASTGSGDPDILITAPMDEHGYVVSEIREDGYIRVQPLSRTTTTLFHQFHEGHLVDIVTNRRTVKGVVAIPSSHITRNKSSAMSLSEFIIDTGSETAHMVRSLGIDILDPVTAVKDFAKLQNGKIAGTGLSRKYAAFALLEAVKELEPGSNITFAWSAVYLKRNQGIMRLARSVNADRVLCLSTFTPTFNRSTGSRNRPVSSTGSGVLIDEVRLNSSRFSEIRAKAAELGLTVTPSHSGRLMEYRYFGEETAVIALAVENRDSLVEVIDCSDIEQMVRLLVSIVN